MTQGRNPTVQQDASGFVAIDSTKLWKNTSDMFVLAETCEQVLNIKLYIYIYIYIYILFVIKKKLTIILFHMQRFFSIQFLQNPHGGT